MDANNPTVVPDAAIRSEGPDSSVNGPELAKTWPRQDTCRLIKGADGVYQTWLNGRYYGTSNRSEVTLWRQQQELYQQLHGTFEGEGPSEARQG
jgi:hypothetical protein